MRALPLSLKVALVFTGIVLCIAMALIISAHHHSHNALKQTLQQSLSRNGNVIMTNLNHLLAKSEAELLKFSHANSLLSSMSGSQDVQIERVVSLTHQRPPLQDIDRITVRNIQGEILAETKSEFRAEGDRLIPSEEKAYAQFQSWHLVQFDHEGQREYALMSVLPIVAENSQRLLGSIEALILIDENAQFFKDLAILSGSKHLALQIENKLMPFYPALQSKGMDPNMPSNQIFEMGDFLYSAVPINQSVLAFKNSRFIVFMDSNPLKSQQNHAYLLAGLAGLMTLILSSFIFLMIRASVKEQSEQFVDEMKDIAAGKTDSAEIQGGSLAEVQHVAGLTAHIVQNLKQKEEGLERILNQIGFPVLICDKEGRVVQINHKALQLFEVQKRDDQEIWLKNLLPELTQSGQDQKCAFHRGLDGEAVQEIETKIKHFKTARCMTYSWRLTDLKLKETDNRSYCLIDGQDISRLIKLETYKKPETSSAEHMLGLATEFIWESDANHKIIKIRPLKNIFDEKKYAHLIGRTLWDLCPKKIENIHFITRETCELKRPFSDQESGFYFSDGSLCVINLHGVPMIDEASHEFLGYSGTAQNIMKVFNQREELTDTLKIAQENQEINDKFLASISHEFRTPLNGILGFAQLMMLSKKEVLTASQEEHMGQIVKSGTSLLKLVDGVLDLVKIETRNFDLNFELIEPAHILQEVTNILEPMAQENRIHLVCHNVSDLSGYMRADRQFILRILMDLGSNAIKFNQEEGQVILDCAPTQDQSRLVFTVKDDGFGMSEDCLRDIFKPFFRYEKSNSNRAGKGVGLAIVKQLVDVMEGDIQVQSQEGQGSQFTVSFPLINQDQKQLYEKEDNLILSAPPQAEGVSGDYKNNLLN